LFPEKKDVTYMNRRVVTLTGPTVRSGPRMQKKDSRRKKHSVHVLRVGKYLFSASPTKKRKLEPEARTIESVWRREP